MLKILVLLMSKFPLPVLHAFGVCLGWIVYAVSPGYRRTLWANVRIAFPEQPQQQKTAVRGSVAHVGMALLELPFLWGRPSHKGAAKCGQISGWSLIEQAQAQGKGVIFLTPHMGSFESTAQIFATRHPVTVLYRPNRRADVQQVIETSRRRDGVELAPTNLAGVKLLLKALKRGEAVGLLPDQVPSSGEGVWAPMFGQPAYTMTLPAKLQQATGALIVLVIGYRKPWGQGFELNMYPGPTQLSTDPVEAATQVNQAMESLILKHPEQYYWGYARYKPPKHQ